MQNRIYFQKVIFSECLGDRLLSSLLLLPQTGELAYQAFDSHKQAARMPAITGLQGYRIGRHTGTEPYAKAARILRSSGNGFRPQLLPTETDEAQPVFCWHKQLSAAETEALLPYCNALDFEPYRERTMSLNDEGVVAYRDEITLAFTGISASHLPMLELPMALYYDESRLWPSERLYRYLLRHHLETQPALRKWITPYGGFSLPVL